MKDRVVTSVFWMVWSKGGAQAISLLSTLFIARLLTPSDYGIISLATIWIFPISLIAEMGLGAAIIQFRDLSEKELNGCFWLINAIALIGYCALYVSAPAISQWFNSPMLTAVLRVNGLMLPLVAIRVVPDSLLRKSLAFDKISKSELVSAVLTIPAMLALALSGAGVWTLVGGMLVGALTQTALTYWYFPWCPGWKCGGDQISDVLKFSVSTLGSKICWATYRQADFFVLGKISGDVVLGFYSMAKQLATLPVDKISSVVNQLAFPMMAELQDKQDVMRTSFLRGFRLVATLTFPLCVGMLFVAYDLVHVLLTDKWSPAVPALQILCVYAIVRSIDILLPAVLLARFRANFLFGYTFALLILMPLAFISGAWWAGALGVSAAWVMFYPVLMARMAQEAFHELGISARTAFRQLVPALSATGSMIIALAVLGWSLSAWPETLVFVRLAIMITAGALAYGATLFMLNSGMWFELQEVFGWAIGKGRLIKSRQEVAV